MNFHDFITRDELNSLPDDADAAFCEFVRIASGRLKDEIRTFDDNSEEGWHSINAARHGFVNVIVAGAKKFEVEPFATMSMPKFDQKNPYNYEQFKYDLDHYVTQIEIGSLFRERKNSVDLPVASRDRIRGHLHGLRQCVEDSKMSPARKETLLRKLHAFEAELEKRRLNFLEVSLVAMSILSFPGGVWASGDMVGKLVSNILAEVGEAKREEEELRAVAAPAPTLALSPPRLEGSEPKQIAGYGSRGGYGGRPSVEMDDEIPF